MICSCVNLLRVRLMVAVGIGAAVARVDGDEDATDDARELSDLSMASSNAP